MAIWFKINNEYEVSKLGEVKSLSRKVNCKNGFRITKEKILKPNFQKKTGYYSVTLHKVMSIHRLVATAFIPNPENKPFVNHKDGNKLNNNVDNLEWVTASENGIHAFKSGLLKIKKGESYKSKLTEKEVLEIRASNLKQKELSILYKVNIPTINLIVNRKTWTHI
jgi:hypothetical protein